MTPAQPTEAEKALAWKLASDSTLTTTEQSNSIAQALAEARENAHEDGVRDGIAREWQKNNPSLSFEPTEARSAPVCIGPSESDALAEITRIARIENYTMTYEARYFGANLMADWFRSHLRPLKLPEKKIMDDSKSVADPECNRIAGFNDALDAVEKMNK